MFATILYLVRPASGGMRGHLQTLLNHFGARYPVCVAAPGEEKWMLPDGHSRQLSLAPGFSPGRDLGSGWRCYRLIKELHPSLVHIHGFKAALVGCPAARLARVPALVTAHNYPAHRGGAVVIPPLAMLPGTHYIAVSHALARKLASWGIARSRIRVIHNGIDPEPFEQVSRQRSTGNGKDGRLVVGTVARMAPQKGLQYLVSAAGLLAAKYPKMRFIIAGDGPQRRPLQDLAGRMGLEHRISFPGYCSDLPAALSQMDIFVLPSLTEGLAITLLEAMAAGCAVVAARVGGVPEIITHGATGLLVEPGSAEELTSAVGVLAGNPNLRWDMACAGREIIRVHFTAEHMLQQTEAFYRSLLSHPKDTATG